MQVFFMQCLFTKYKVQSVSRSDLEQFVPSSILNDSVNTYNSIAHVYQRACFHKLSFLCSDLNNHLRVFISYIWLY